MSFTKTATLASACLLVSVAIASADEVRLTDETLDTVTAGEITPLGPIPPLSGGLDGSPTLFGPLNPMPEPESPVVTPPTTTPPTFPGGGDPLGGLQQLLQQLLAFGI